MTPRVGLYDDPLFRRHDAGPGHPERPQRLDAVRRGLAPLEARLELLAPREATPEEVLRVHTETYRATLAATEGRTRRLDPDTQASPDSYRAALRAAGAVVDAVDRVLDGRLERAFCAVRPPGHHAEADRAMGFCLLNNVAVGAAHALARGLERVLIVVTLEGGYDLDGIAAASAELGQALLGAVAPPGVWSSPLGERIVAAYRRVLTPLLGCRFAS